MRADGVTRAELLALGRQVSAKIREWQEHRAPVLEMGDLFYLKMPISVPVIWCAVAQHPNDPQLWICVPGDSFSLASSTDVVVAPSEHLEALNFRCHCGLWVHADDIDLKFRVDRLSSETNSHLRNRIVELARDPVAVFSRGETADDPDYQEWIDELRVAVEALAGQLHDEVPEHAYIVGKELSIEQGEMPLNLAAASYDADEPMESHHPLLDSRRIPASVDGEIVARLYADGVIVEWRRIEKSQRPPQLTFAGTAIRWFGDESFAYSELLSWVKGQVELSINAKPYRINLE